MTTNGIMGIYKPPSVTDNDFSDSFTKNLDGCIMNHDCVLLLGDLNFDMLNDKNCKSISDIFDIFNLSQ